MEERLEKVETRIGYQDRLLDELNEVIIKQQRQIDLLERRVEALNGVVAGLDPNGIEQGEEPPPPHY